LREIEDWIAEFLANRSGIDVDRTESYIDAGAIDSLCLIELVEEVEKKYGFRFEGREFQDRRFVTITGLAEIVYGKL
jgi:acyl carrier protein